MIIRGVFLGLTLLLLGGASARADMDCGPEPLSDGKVYQVCLADGEFRCYLCAYGQIDCREVTCPPDRH
jgi:hypothetical protein